MANNTMLAVGGVAVAGLLYFMSTSDSETSTLGDTQAPSFVGGGGGGEANNRTEKVEGANNFLDDCAITTSETDGSESCETPLYLANETITIEHPLSATNSDYSQYYFTVKIESDVLTSMTKSAFDSAPASEMLGDYSITVQRSGPYYESGRWTVNQNPDFNGSLTLNGLITKGNANDSATSVIPTWEQCLNAFGGYMPNKIGALGDEVLFRSGDFNDVGEFRYLKKAADGQDYPTTTNKFALDMSGNVIPLYAQMEIKCVGDWNAVGGLTQVSPSNLLPAGEECYAPCYPAVLPTSGVALGCELPTVSISYPNRIYIMCHGEVEDCSDRATTSTGGNSPDEIWNLNPAITVPTTMQKGTWETDSGRVWGILFDSIGTPKIYQDGQGWYVKYANSSSKTYINSVLPAFKAAYTRQSVECECPSDTMLEGTKFNLLDKFSCPSGGILSGIFGGSTEWKDTYCGGLKPDYGCTDARATNYNSSKVKDPTDTDVCNPKYCNYGSNQVLPECQGSGGGLGGGGGLGDFISPVTPIDSSGGGQDERPSPPLNGGVGVGVGGGTGGVIRFAETTLKPSKLINTSHSFLNW